MGQRRSGMVRGGRLPVQDTVALAGNARYSLLADPQETTSFERKKKEKKENRKGKKKKNLFSFFFCALSPPKYSASLVDTFLQIYFLSIS